MEYVSLILSLFVILVCAEAFTNGVEVFGERLSLSQAVVGSILAAIGTALPETIIPLVAILLYKGEGGSQIGVGAILGAPFMLATIGMCMVGLGALISFLQRKRNFEIYIEENTFRRDFSFFLLSYSLAIAGGVFFTDNKPAHYILAFLLILLYTGYIYQTFRADSLEVEAHEDLYLSRIFKKLSFKVGENAEKLLSLLQAVIAILVMVKGAHMFVEAVEKISIKFGFDPLLFSLLIAPVATELPEKFNSFLWSLRKRDILALGNISGAMVFQSTFPVSVGLIFTSWKIEGLGLLSAIIAIGIIFVYWGYVSRYKRLPIPLLLLSGLSYVGYAVLVVVSITHGRT